MKTCLAVCVSFLLLLVGLLALVLFVVWDDLMSPAHQTKQTAAKTEEAGGGPLVKVSIEELLKSYNEWERKLQADIVINTHQRRNLNVVASDQKFKNKTLEVPGGWLIQVRDGPDGGATAQIQCRPHLVVIQEDHIVSTWKMSGDKGTAYKNGKYVGGGWTHAKDGITFDVSTEQKESGHLSCHFDGKELSNLAKAKTWDNVVVRGVMVGHYTDRGDVYPPPVIQMKQCQIVSSSPGYQGHPWHIQGEVNESKEVVVRRFKAKYGDHE